MALTDTTTHSLILCGMDSSGKRLTAHMHIFFICPGIGVSFGKIALHCTTNRQPHASMWKSIHCVVKTGNSAKVCGKIRHALKNMMIAVICSQPSTTKVLVLNLTISCGKNKYQTVSIDKFLTRASSSTSEVAQLLRSR